ncbi:hypothetical protein BDF22DRAFT_670901 [Syncephalis plumigaleata]|nr:hypothetical protein BDF22DRAFT_670901 [Syncephalis plumigaleata]
MFESAPILRLTYCRSLYSLTGNVATCRIDATRIMAFHSTSINEYQRQWDKDDAPSLSDFILQAQIRQLYREFQRTIRRSEISEADRDELLGWVRHEFKRDRTMANQDALRTLLSEGRRQLHQLERSLMLSGLAK